ncbi:MAG: septum formation protein Maf [Coprococcus sp.]|nr:septum formation protein Maf [Coprococcus sp.]
MKDTTVILASASPRRTKLLAQAGIRHLVLPSTCEERVSSRKPEEVVTELSRQKAEDVYTRYRQEHSKENILVIGADTVVAVGGRILGKPKDRDDAFRMISMLQGNTHQVYTGVTLLEYRNAIEKEDTFFECSHVQVYPMDDSEIRCYIGGGEPMDKAGAYGIQGEFAVFIKKIEGDYHNIVGLPIARIYQELKKHI